MDIKFIFVFISSFNFILGSVEKKLKKLRGDLGEESDEDEDVVRIQWEGNGNFGKKFSIFSDINSAESGKPLPILQPPFYYYSSSIKDFERENSENRGGLGDHLKEGNGSDSGWKLRIYEITSGRSGKEKLRGKSDFERARENFGQSRNENNEKGKSSGESENFGNNRNVGNLGEFDNNENVRKLNENFGNRDDFEKWDSGNFGKGSSQNFGDESGGDDKNGEFAGDLEKLKSVNSENWGVDRRNFGNFEHEKLTNLKVMSTDEKFGNQNFGNGRDWRVLKEGKNVGNQSFENGRNLKDNENSGRKTFENGRNLKVLKIDENFRNQEIYRAQNQNFENFGNNHSLKVLRIDENFERFPPTNSRAFGNNVNRENLYHGHQESGKNLKAIKFQNVQILTQRRKWFNGAKNSEDQFKTNDESDDFGDAKKPENYQNHQKKEYDINREENEETGDGAGESSIWDPSKTFKKLKPAQSLSVIKPSEASQSPRGNRKYQDSEEMAERRNWEFSRGEYLRKKVFQNRVNHFRYLDTHSKFGAIPGVPGRDYPVNTEHKLRVMKKFLCPVHADTHVYIADRSTRCQVFYVCYGSNSGVQMVCPDGTLFNQQLQVCDWWFNVTC